MSSSSETPSDRSLPGIQPPGGGGIPRSFKVGCLVILGLIVLAFGGCAAFVAVAGNSPSPVDHTYAARAACEDSIKDRLKSPSTAKFDTQVSGSDPYVVSGTVDSENSFGAALRASFKCTVTSGSTVVDYLE